MMETRSSIIDAFRGLAILSVVIFHYTVRWAPPLEPVSLYGYDVVFPAWLNVGAYGVHLFFVISGLVITMTLLRSESVWDFAVRRFARIYPAFVVAAFFTFVAMQFGPERFRVGLADLFANLFVDARLLGGQGVDGVYWSLVVEIKFYALVFLARAAFAEGFWIALVVIAGCSALMLRVDPRFATEAMLAPYWPFFLFGIAGWFWTYGGRREIARVLFVASAALYLVSYDTNHGSRLQPLFVDAFMIVTAGGVLLALRLWPTARIPLLAPLGRVSYSLYLVHQNVGVAIIGGLTSTGVSALPAILITITAMIGLAALAFQYVEVPGGKFVMTLHAYLIRQFRVATIGSA